jgi:hypothetical protein
MKTRAFLANEKARQLLQRKFVGVQPFIAANKTKLIMKTKTTDAPRKTYSAFSNKNIVS